LYIQLLLQIELYYRGEQCLWKFESAGQLRQANSKAEESVTNSRRLADGSEPIIAKRTLHKNKCPLFNRSMLTL